MPGAQSAGINPLPRLPISKQMHTAHQGVPIILNDWFGSIWSYKLTTGNCSFSFTCRKNWEQLIAGNYDNIRHCEACDRSVFKCHTRGQHQLGSALGRCIAFTEGNEIIGVIGEPDGEWDFLLEPSNIVSIRKTSEHSPEQTKQLQTYYPTAFSDSGLMLFQSGQWLALGTFFPFVARALVQELAEESFGIEVRQVDMSQPNSIGNL